MENSTDKKLITITEQNKRNKGDSPFDPSNLLIIQRPKTKAGLILASTKLNLNQITRKLLSFCKSNHLFHQEKGYGKFLIWNKIKDSFLLEVVIYNMENYLKIYHINGNEIKTKEIMGRLFVELNK